MPAPVSYENWRAHRKGLPRTDRAEIPLYSDIDLSLAPSEKLGPYRLQHAFAAESHDPVMILFVDDHLEDGNIDMSKTDTRRFTGSPLGDELAALLSLSVGRRFMAGDATRVTSPSNPNQWIIMADRSRPVFFQPTAARMFGPKAPIIRRAREKVEIHLGHLSTFADVPPQAATSLVRAARLYRDGLWIAETEPSLAWLLLISAIEVAAVHHRSALPELDILRSSKPELVKRLEAVDPTLAEEVATHLSRELRATARFLAFMRDFLPEPPTNRPPDVPWTRLVWEPTPMRKMLEKIYHLRSLALHEGVPFPPPMSRSPHIGAADWAAPSERVLGLAAATSGGVWTADDLPMSLHSFEYIARGALLNWWNGIVAA